MVAQNFYFERAWQLSVVTAARAGSFAWSRQASMQKHAVLCSTAGGPGTRCQAVPENQGLRRRGSGRRG